MPHIEGKTKIQWYYDLTGPEDDDAEVLVFIHGWGVTRRIWRQQSKYFADKYRVLVLDLPGHGQSSWHKVSLEEMAEDLIKILKGLSFNHINMVGSSLGGMLALKMYGISPELFKRIIFVGSQPKFSKSEDYPYGIDIPRIKKLEQQLDTSYPQIVNIFFRSLFTAEERESRRFKWLQTFRKTEDIPIQPALIDFLDVLEHEDLRDILVDVKCPIHFINGAEDHLCPKEMYYAFKESLPQAHFTWFEKCGHFPFLTKPHEFNEVLEEFIKNK